MFTPSNMLQKYLSAQPRDIYDIVGALMGYINADPYFKTNEFDEALKYVLSNGVSENELFQSFDSEIDFQIDEGKWDEDYYAYSRVYLKDNFCRKRIEHVKAVAHKLHPVVRVPEPKRTAPVSVQEVKRTETQFQNKPVQNISGGQQSKGKKYQDHQTNPTTYQKRAGIKGLVICVVIVLMVVLAFIISR